MMLNSNLQRFFISDYLFAYFPDMDVGTRVLRSHIVLDTDWDAKIVSPYLAWVKAIIATQTQIYATTSKRTTYEEFPGSSTKRVERNRDY